MRFAYLGEIANLLGERFRALKSVFLAPFVALAGVPFFFVPVVPPVTLLLVNIVKGSDKYPNGTETCKAD